MICGRLCCGKSTYAERLRKKLGAVLLSIDEIMLGLFGQQTGEMHDEYVSRTEKYLLSKSVELIESGINVVLDWGAWSKAKRAEIRDFYNSRGIGYELHYLKVSDEIWKERIAKRNNAVSEGNADAYYIDENLAAKFGAVFEPPTDEEIDKEMVY